SPAVGCRKESADCPQLFPRIPGIGVRELIHRGAPDGRLIRKHSAAPQPRRAWLAAVNPPAIHSFIPSLCAQALDIAGFLSESREPAAALACSDHPPACAQLHP